MLERRLAAVAELLLPSGRVADIGAGDGQLARFLAERGYSVVAVEASRRGFSSLAGRLGDIAEVRLGDGLRPLRPGEVDQVVIAGLGPHTILRILREGAAKVPFLARLVLLPHRDAWPIRQHLGDVGLTVVAERLVLQRRHIYQVLALAPGEAPPLSALEVLLGPWNLRQPSEELSLLARRYLERFRRMRHPPLGEGIVEQLEAFLDGLGDLVPLRT